MNALTPVAMSRLMVAPSSGHPDEELLTACAEFCRLERAWQTTNWTATPNSPEDVAADQQREVIRLQQEPWLERIFSAQVATTDGALAISACLEVFYNGDDEWSDANAGTCINTRMEAALLRSLRDVRRWNGGRP